MEQATSANKFLRPLVREWEIQDYRVTARIGLIDAGWELRMLGVPDKMWEVYRAKWNHVQSADEYGAWAVAQAGASGGKKYQAALKTITRRWVRLRQILEASVKRLHTDRGFPPVLSDEFASALSYHAERLDVMPKVLGVTRSNGKSRSMSWERKLKSVTSQAGRIINANATQPKHETLRRLMKELDDEVQRTLQPPSPEGEEKALPAPQKG